MKAPPKNVLPAHDDESDAVDPDDELSSVDGSLPDDEDEDMAGADEAAYSDNEAADKLRSRKRKRLGDNEDLEANYMSKLADDEAPREKKPKSDDDAEFGSDDSDDEEAPKKPTTPSEFPIAHETVAGTAETELAKSARTVFLGNVPTSVITSKADYKTFKNFFKAAGNIQSLRFRSVAFSEQIPRKAAFVNHKLHEKASSVNVYIVFVDAAAARKALKFNGEVVLGHHIRVDSVAHPAPHEPKRCVFVGNLDFEAQEESLWKHFLQCGKVESVRIVRDSKTNMGKGFAYVQFEVRYN